MIPAKANPEEQEKFLEEELKPLLREASEGIRSVFFMDAAHFVLAPFLGFLWSVVRIFIKAPCGRQRFNVLGALNVITHELITFKNDTYITSASVCELLQKLASSGSKVPISVVLDNARYQRCAATQETARALNIELCFLPTYSPNLNLIERLWRFTKKKCLYSKYYENFAEFKEAITQCLEQTHTTYRSDLSSLLTLNFQVFKKTQF